jgi:hypothetical protein
VRFSQHASHCRSSSHVSDRVLIQFTASEWPLKVSTCSIVPSGHSASTDHFSPSLSTTQKTGFTIVNPTTGRPANNHYGALQQICGWSGRCPQHKSRRIIYEVRRLVASFRQAIFSNAFLNAFWNAFSKSFTSSEAPACCAIATKRLWRSASVSLGLASDLRVMLRNPARAGKVVA